MYVHVPVYVYVHVSVYVCVHVYLDVHIRLGAQSREDTRATAPSRGRLLAYACLSRDEATAMLPCGDLAAIPQEESRVEASR